MLDGSLNLLIDALRKSSRFLNRDFFELENLQSSSRGVDGFVKKSCEKLLLELKESLGKYHKTVIFSEEEAIAASVEKEALLVELLDGYSNFARSMYFFAIIVTLVSKKDDVLHPEKVIINFPALNEIVYAMKGKGAWKENHSGNTAGGAVRARVSAVSEVKNSVIGASNEHYNKAAGISQNVRIFGSNAYLATLVASGKLDAALFPKRNLSCHGLQLLITEAGGVVSLDSDLFAASNNRIIV